MLLLRIATAFLCVLGGAAAAKSTEPAGRAVAKRGVDSLFARGGYETGCKDQHKVDACKGKVSHETTCCCVCSFTPSWQTMT